MGSPAPPSGRVLSQHLPRRCSPHFPPGEVSLLRSPGRPGSSVRLPGLAKEPASLGQVQPQGQLSVARPGSVARHSDGLPKQTLSLPVPFEPLRLARWAQRAVGGRSSTPPLWQSILPSPTLLRHLSPLLSGCRADSGMEPAWARSLVGEIRHLCMHLCLPSFRVKAVYAERP